MPVGADDFRRGAAHGRRGLPRAQEACSRARASTPPSATRAASPRTSKTNEEALEVIVRGHREGRLQARQGHLHRARPGRQRVLRRQDGKYDLLEGEGRRAHQRRDGRLLRRAGATSTRSSRIEDGLAEDDWDGWKLLTDSARRQDPARRRRPVRHQHRAPRSAASTSGAANSILIKVNQIGTLTETLDAIEMAKRAGCTAVVSPPLRRDRGHDHRRPRRGHERRADQDRLRLPHRPRGQVQPAAAHRGDAGRDRPLPGRGSVLQPEEVEYSADDVRRARAAEVARPRPRRL